MGSIIVISAHAEYSIMLKRIQILNPGSRRNMLQGPDPIYGCGQFYMRESSLLMHFLAAGDVLFGFEPSNIIGNML